MEGVRQPSRWTRLTLDDFYGELARVAPEYRWALRGDGAIRGSKTVGHLWAAVEVVTAPTTAHYELCGNTGICGIQHTLLLAEDNKPGHDPAVRARLLEVLKL